MQIKIGNVILVIGTGIISLAMVLLTLKHSEDTINKSVIIVEFGSMESAQKEIINLPPFISISELKKEMESFVDLAPKKNTYISLSVDYCYYLSVMINNVGYVVYLNKNAEFANETQNTKGADKIRRLLLIIKGKEWYNNKFDGLREKEFRYPPATELD